MTDDAEVPRSELVVYQTEDGRTRIECRFEERTIWLSQAQMAQLFQVTVPTINEHLKGIYADGEVPAAATIRKLRMVRTEGNRTVSRLVDHYSLPAILAVGYRVRSPRGTQFRQWATGILSEYLLKGFGVRALRRAAPRGAGSRRRGRGAALARSSGEGAADARQEEAMRPATTVLVSMAPTSPLERQRCRRFRATAHPSVGSLAFASARITSWNTRTGMWPRETLPSP